MSYTAIFRFLLNFFQISYCIKGSETPSLHKTFAFEISNDTSMVVIIISHNETIKNVILSSKPFMKCIFPTTQSIMQPDQISYYVSSHPYRILLLILLLTPHCLIGCISNHVVFIYNYFHIVSCTIETWSRKSIRKTRMCRQQGCVIPAI